MDAEHSIREPRAAGFPGAAAAERQGAWRGAGEGAAAAHGTTALTLLLRIDGGLVETVLDGGRAEQPPKIRATRDGLVL